MAELSGDRVQRSSSASDLEGLEGGYKEVLARVRLFWVFPLPVVLPLEFILVIWLWKTS